MKGRAALLAVLFLAGLHLSACSDPSGREIEKLGSPEPAVRRQAVKTLAALQTPKSARALIVALQDRDWQVRAEAAKGLGSLKDPQAVTPLVACLKDEDWYVRLAAVEALGNLGDSRAVEPLLPCLKDKNRRVRLKTLTALGRLPDQKVFDILLPYLEDEDIGVRRAAAQALGELNDPRAVEPFIRALNDENLFLIATQALGRLKNPQAVPFLLNKRGPSAIKALAQIGDPRAIGPLMEQLRKLDLEELEGLGQLLKKSKDGQVAEQLLQKLQNASLDGFTRARAALLLGYLGEKRAFSPILEALNDKDSNVRRSAAQALGYLEDRRAVDALLKALKEDEDIWVRLGAARALAQLGASSQATPIVLADLHHENETLRKYAAEALGILKDPRALPPLLEVLKQERDRWVWRTAACALAEFQDPRVEPALREALALKDSGIRSAAAYALVSLHRKEGQRKLVECLLNENLYIRDHAAARLGLFDELLKKISLSPFEHDSIRSKITFNNYIIFGTVDDLIKNKNKPLILKIKESPDISLEIHPMDAIKHGLLTKLKISPEGVSIEKNDYLSEGNFVGIFLCHRKANNFIIQDILPFPKGQEELLDAL